MCTKDIKLIFSPARLPGKTPSNKKNPTVEPKDIKGVFFFHPIDKPAFIFLGPGGRSRSLLAAKSVLVMLATYQ